MLWVWRVGFALIARAQRLDDSDECDRIVEEGDCAWRPRFADRRCGERCGASLVNAPQRGRLLLEDVVPPQLLQQLLATAPQAVRPGDGFERPRPFRRNEVWAGIQPVQAAQWAMATPNNESALAFARSLIEVTRAMKRIIDDQFLLTASSLHFAQLACRFHEPSGEPGDSMPVHADNCVYQEPSHEENETCVLREGAAGMVSHAGYLYLGGDFEGGDFFYVPDWHSPPNARTRVRPAPGRMVAIAAGGSNLHGVMPMTDGTRCHMAVWLTCDQDLRGAQSESLQEAEAILAHLPPLPPAQDWRADNAAFKSTCAETVQEPQVLATEDKAELLSDLPGPRISRIPGFLSPEEAQHLIDMARPLLQEAVVIEEGELVKAKYRNSRTAWLGPQEETDGILQKISKRIEEFTGLSLKSAEEFQVAQYLSEEKGHYAHHFDWGVHVEVTQEFGTFQDEHRSELRGPRLATFLMYLNDVAGGGVTTFVRQNISLHPTVGTAVFWHNLLPGQEGDQLVNHGACPVTAGEKFIMTQWIHLAGNEHALDAAMGLPRVTPVSAGSKLCLPQFCFSRPLQMARSCPGSCEEDAVASVLRGRAVLEDVMPFAAVRRLHALAASSPVSLWEFVRPGLDEELSIVESFARQVASNFSRPLVKSSQEGLHLDGAEAICRSADSDDFSEHAGYIPAGEDLHIAEMTLDQAKDFCRRLELCNGFTLQDGDPAVPTDVYFKSQSEVQDGDSEGWRSFRRERHKVRHGPDAVPPQAANCYKEGPDCLRKFPAMFWRSHMAVLFLHQSDDFKGGFYFTPHFNSTDRVWVNPAVGKAVAFAAGAHNLHGLDISSGQLCTLSLWLTPDASRASRVLEAATDELEEL